MLALFFYLPLALVLYHLILFPLALYAWASRREDETFPPLPDNQLPSVDLLIAARNEEQSIGAKLENCLELDYPHEKLRIVVLANGCGDKTVGEVMKFADRGVVVIEEGDIGKAEAQNRAADASNADILVFSDANTLYDQAAIRHLVAPFTDPTVGAVSGRHKYISTDRPSGAGERIYWNFLETSLKRAESITGGAIGANGSIYAVRRDRYVPVDPDLISDFIEPLLIAADGYRTVYAPEAVSFEETEKSFDLEYARKVRIVRRSVYSLMRMSWLANPINTGRLSLLLISHKVLRWLTPVFVLVALLASTLRLLFRKGNKLDLAFFTGMTLLGFLGLLGRGLAKEVRVPVLTQVYYIYMLFRASIVGISEALVKGGTTVWDHARSDG